MHIIWTILIGFLAGLVARAIMPGDNNPGGFFLTACIGIAGSISATYLGRMLNFYQEGSSAGFIGAVIGAIILLTIYHLFTKK